MKKYNKPEIVTLALDTVDVIETSTGSQLSASYLQEKGYTNVASIEENISEMKNTWTW